LMAASSAFLALAVGRLPQGIGQAFIAILIVAAIYYFLRGSDKARIGLALLALLWLVWSLFMLFIIPGSDFIPMGFIAAILVLALSACSYFLLFSGALRDELFRRAEMSAKRDLEERRKLYESMGEKGP
ncbi:MAG TPA: hypothetical protein VMX97_14945, partial [Hyphomicrobiaceae bacterium]|nr:hypothetical protein [Hyphomicrobiaceae bacterium]